MRYGIFTDIHANIEALDAILEVFEKEGVERTICLGDIVGYGANPNEVIQRIQKQRYCKTIIGNHDVVAISREQDVLFNSAARGAIRWTAEQLTPDARMFLNSLPYTINLRDIFLCHSSPDNPKEWYYLTDEAAADYSFSYFAERICLIGHTHVPRVFSKEIQYESTFTDSPVEQSNLSEKTPLFLEQNKQYIINCGSVGQPRDGDPRACGGILDMENSTFQLVRVAYDIEKAAEKIRAAGLASRLADRLFVGR